MGAEVARPIALTLCLVALCAVFHAAFMTPVSHLEERIWNALELLAVTAGICISSGLLFRDSAPEQSTERRTLGSTLPMQLFSWASALMLVLFLASWYLETHCIFYRDARHLYPPISGA